MVSALIEVQIYIYSCSKFKIHFYLFQYTDQFALLTFLGCFICQTSFLIFKQVYMKIVKIENPMESFYLIDIIQRFGIEHYFAEEIKVALENLHLILNTNPIDFVSSHELNEVALAFRLLRQGGHYVNAG